MPDQTPVPPPREVAGQVLRRSTKGDTVVPWGQLSATRRELWCASADPVVHAALRALATTAADVVARELYLSHHQRAGTLTEWTAGEWDHGGAQHVDKTTWRDQARALIRLVEDSYRQTT
jgi:hypothetical protein